MSNIRQLSHLNYILIVVASFVAVTILVLTFIQGSALFIALLGIFSTLLVMMQQLLQQKKTDVDDAEAKLTNQVMVDIHETATKKTLELENKQKVISQFLRRGIVKEQDLIDALNQQSFIILFHFNRQVNKDFAKFLPNNKIFSKVICEELGFVAVAPVQGGYFFHVINSRALPHQLQNITYLEAYIKKRLVEYWAQLESNLKQDPKLLETFKTHARRKGNLSYFLGKIFPANLSIGYVNFSSFDTRFLEYCGRFVSSKELEINTQELRTLISLASIDFFIDTIEPVDRNIISQNESKIKNELKIGSLFDYATISHAAWQRVLSVYFGEVKAANYTEIISSKARELCPIIKEFL